MSVHKVKDVSDLESMLPSHFQRISIADITLSSDCVHTSIKVSNDYSFLPLLSLTLKEIVASGFVNSCYTLLMKRFGPCFCSKTFMAQLVFSFIYVSPMCVV